MANRLKMAMVQSILTLHARGWSGRRIAARAGRESRDGLAVRPVGEQAESAGPAEISKPANAPISEPAGATAHSNPATAPTGMGPGSPQRLPTVARDHRGQAGARAFGPADLSGPGQRARAAAATTACGGSCKRLGWTRPLPFRRMECEPGEEAQVDFGTGAPIVGAGRQAAADARLSHRADAQPQGLQRGGLPADDRGLHALPGERLLAFRRRAARRW